MLESKLAQAEDRAVNAEREKASVSVEFEQELFDLKEAGVNKLCYTLKLNCCLTGANEIVLNGKP